MRRTEARKVIEATLHGDAPPLPFMLARQMPLLLQELHKCMANIKDKRAKARSLKAGFAEKNLQWAEDHLQSAIENVEITITPGQDAATRVRGRAVLQTFRHARGVDPAWMRP